MMGCGGGGGVYGPSSKDRENYQIKQVIYNQNKYHSMFPGVSDVGRDNGMKEVERNNQRNGRSENCKYYGSKELLVNPSIKN